jgi:putative hydrolase of the HAD superfamily
MGNVIFYFDHHKAARQLAALHQSTEDEAWKMMFEDKLYERFDRGDITATEAHREFCNQMKSDSKLEDFEFAISNIFQVNSSLIPLISQLDNVGYRLGILSNTCSSHWDFVNRHYSGIIQANFSKFALSYEIGAIKPDQKIYQRAAEIAGVAPEEVFYCDDIAGHIEGAKKAGFNAVVFESTHKLAEDMRAAGLKFNY